MFSGPSVFLKGQYHEMYIFVEGLNILIGTFCVCADGFQGLSKAFHYPVQLLAFYLILWNYLQIFENAYWNPPQNSLLCDWSIFSSADLSLAAEKMRKNYFVTWSFGSGFTESQAASCMHYDCSHRRCRVAPKQPLSTARLWTTWAGFPPPRIFSFMIITMFVHSLNSLSVLVSVRPLCSSFLWEYALNRCQLSSGIAAPEPINRMCIELSLWSCSRYYMSTPRTGKNLGKF